MIILKYLKIELLLIGLLGTTNSVLASNQNEYNHLSKDCANVTTLRDRHDWTEDSGGRLPGGYSCLADQNDRDVLKKMNDMIKANYKVRDRRKALAETVALLNLTQEKSGVKCRNGKKGGLECRYTDLRGKERVRKFPSLTADYANLYLDKLVTTPLEEKYKIENPFKTPEERIADLEKQLQELETETKICGCSSPTYGDSGNPETFTPNTYNASNSKQNSQKTKTKSKNKNRSDQKANTYRTKGAK